MRNWSFTFINEEDCMKSFAEFQALFNESEDFKKKKIFFCALKGKDDIYKIFLGIEDTVVGSFKVSTINEFDKNLENVFVAFRSDCKDITVELPADCKIASWWEPERMEKR